MIVADVIDKKKNEMFTIGADDTLQDALEIMAAEEISSLPVVDDAGHLIGIISERDYIRKAAPKKNCSLGSCGQRLHDKRCYHRNKKPCTQRMYENHVRRADKTFTGYGGSQNDWNALYHRRRSRVAQPGCLNSTENPYYRPPSRT